jgi:hypothetical protein
MGEPVYVGGPSCKGLVVGWAQSTSKGPNHRISIPMYEEGAAFVTFLDQVSVVLFLM